MVSIYYVFRICTVFQICDLESVLLKAIIVMFTPQAEDYEYVFLIELQHQEASLMNINKHLPYLYNPLLAFIVKGC